MIKEAWFFGGTQYEHKIVDLTLPMVEHLYNNQLALLLVLPGSPEMEWLSRWVRGVKTNTPYLLFTLFFPSMTPDRLASAPLGKWHILDGNSIGAHTRLGRIEIADINGQRIWKDDVAVGVLASIDGVRCFDAYAPNEEFIQWRNNAILELPIGGPKEKYTQLLDELLQKSPHRQHALILRKCVDAGLIQGENQRKLLDEKVSPLCVVSSLTDPLFHRPL